MTNDFNSSETLLLPLSFVWGFLWLSADFSLQCSGETEPQPLLILKSPSTASAASGEHTLSCSGLKYPGEGLKLSQLMILGLNWRER